MTIQETTKKDDMLTTWGNSSPWEHSSIPAQQKEDDQHEPPRSFYQAVWNRINGDHPALPKTAPTGRPKQGPTRPSPSAPARIARRRRWGAGIRWAAWTALSVRAQPLDGQWISHGGEKKESAREPSPKKQWKRARAQKKGTLFFGWLSLKGRTLPQKQEKWPWGKKGHPFLVGSAKLLQTPPHPNWSEWSPISWLS